ncbi:MAG: heme exporter protein CcmB [candidate division WOR-3 bacterium]
MNKLLKKDFLLPFRSFGFFLSYISSNTLLILIFSIAIGNSNIEIINGIFWAIIFINSVLFCLKIVEEEFIEEAFFVLLTYFNIEEIILSKLITSSIYLLFIGMFNAFFMFLLFNQFPFNFYFFIFLIISSISISSISIMLALMLYKIQSKNTIVYLLYIPLSIPIYLSAINGTIEFKLDWLFLSLICLFLYTSMLLFYSEKAIL